MTLRELTIAATLGAVLGLVGPAAAQTAQQAPGSQAPGAATTGQPDPGTAPGGAATGTTGGATSTTGGGTGTTGMTPEHERARATTGGVAAEAGGALEPGANSFTAGQAAARMAEAGFNDVQDLRLDERGIWRGRAMRNGEQTGVALDFRGNVAATR